MHSGKNVKRCLALVPRDYWLRYVLIYPLLVLLIIYPFGGFEALTSKLPYVVAVILVLAVQQPLLALLGCRLAGLPFKPSSSTGEPAFVVGAALLALLGSRRGYEAVDAIILISAVFVAFSAASIVGALRCAPRVRQLLSEGGVCRESCCGYIMWEAVERLGRRVERVVVPAAPNWKIFWLSAALFYLFLISTSLLPTMDAARGELLTMFVLQVSAAALFTALRAALSKRTGSPLCFTGASFLIALPYVGALLFAGPLRVLSTLVGVLIPRSSEPLGIAVPLLFLLALNGAAMIVDMHAAKRSREKLWLCLFQFAVPIISAEDEAAEQLKRSTTIQRR